MRVLYGISLALLVAIGTARAESPLFAYPLERPSSFCIEEAQHQCAKTNRLDFRTASYFRFFVQGYVSPGQPPVNVLLKYVASSGESGYLGGHPVPITIEEWLPPNGGGNPPVYASPLIRLQGNLPKSNVQLFLVWDSEQAPASVTDGTLSDYFAAQPLVEFYAR